MKKILVIGGIFLIGAFIFSLVGHQAMKLTSNDKFCTVCHSWMDPMVETYKGDVHGGNNAMGTKAECVSCHLPHDSLFGYLVKKAKNGLVEGWVMMTEDAKDKDWIKNLERRKEFVFDSGCISCHQNITTSKARSEQSVKMHTLYEKSQGKEDALACVSCHKVVGHDNMGKKLYELKHPPVGEWDLKRFEKEGK